MISVSVWGLKVAMVSNIDRIVTILLLSLSLSLSPFYSEPDVVVYDLPKTQMKAYRSE